jgi:ribosomal protein S14
MNTAKLTQNAREITPNFRFRDREKIKLIDSNRRKLLAATRLSRLPLPAKRSQDAQESACAVCGRNMAEKNALDDLNVCPDCLRIYAAVDQVLTLRANRQTENRKRELMIEKWSKTNR